MIPVPESDLVHQINLHFMVQNGAVVCRLFATWFLANQVPVNVKMKSHSWERDLLTANPQNLESLH